MLRSRWALRGEVAFERLLRSGAIVTGTLALLLAGCSTLPAGRSSVDEVTVVNAKSKNADAVLDKIATAPTQKFLGVFEGVVYDYEVFDPATLQRDLARVTRYYRARGYYSAVARAGRVLTTKANHVRVEIVVEEGPATLVEEVKVLGLEGVPTEARYAAELAASVALRSGKPFDEDKYATCQDDVKAALTDRGYAFASVSPEAYVDVVHHRANVTLTVTPGEPAKFGAITISGLDVSGTGATKQTLPEAPLRTTIGLVEGQAFSTKRIDEAKSALLDLELFAAVTMEPDLSHPESHVVPLAVKLEPIKLRQVQLGGGIEFDGLKSEVHLIGGWEDHNFLGGLRDFTVTLSPGLVFYPTNVGYVKPPTDYLPEAKLRAQLKQPGFIEARTEGIVRAEVNVFPLIVQYNPDAAAPVVGYRQFRGAAGVDRTFFRRLYGSFTYNAQYEDPFSYKDALDPALKPLLISYPDLNLRLDLTDRRDRPHEGVYLANDFQVAGGIFGGDASDIKVQPEVRAYLPIARRVTFATRASIGFLVSSNYGSVVQEHLADAAAANNYDARVRDIETVLFRGFFSGGPTSNRGFPLRGVSPHGIVPFLSPSTAAQQAQNCAPPTAANNFAQPTGDACSVPIGGFTLWEFSNEVRFVVSGPLSAATFCDMSDVSPRQTNIRLDHLHLSCGVGARYDTPVGPVRLDIGYRVQPLQVLGYKNETAANNADSTNGSQPTLFGGTQSDGLPIAIAIGIGEAY